MSSEPTNLASQSRTLWETLEDVYGVDPVPIFQTAGIEPGDLAIPGKRLLFSQIRQVWDEAIRVTGDPYIGIAVGPNLRIANSGFLGFAWMVSESLMDGLQRQARYYHVLSTIAYMIVEEQGPLTKVTFPSDQEVPDYAYHCVMAATLRLCRRAGDKQFSPERVTFRDPEPPPPDLARFKAWFRCPIRFGDDEAAMFLDTNTLMEPLPASNPAIVAAGEKILQRQMESLDEKSLTGQVRDMIVRDLPSGSVSAESVASRLNRSVSSLQRHLRAEGKSFRELVESCRQELARDYLQETDQPLSEIAFLLGYSDQSGFTRAFSRWEGMSPGEFRRRPPPPEARI